MKAKMRKALAVALAAALACGTVPAYRAEAAKKKVYVLTGVDFVATDGSSNEVWRTDNYSVSYNRQGLVASQDFTDNGTKMKYSYDDDGNISKIKKGENETVSIEYDGKNRPKMVTTERKGLSETYTDRLKTSCDKNGNITKVFREQTGSNGKKSFSLYRTYSYDKAGRETGMKSGTYSSWVYSYDGAGNLSQKVDEANSTPEFVAMCTLSNEYAGGRMSAQRKVWNVAAGEAAYTFHYKQISADKSMAKKIEKQQWALLNEDLNNALFAGLLSTNY